MPPSRKACERCRAHKVRCLWTDDSRTCLRCSRSNTTCTTPRRHSEKRTPQRRSGSLFENTQRDGVMSKGRSPSHHQPTRSIHDGSSDRSTLDITDDYSDLSTNPLHGSAWKDGSSNIRAGSALISLPFASLPKVAQLPIGNDICSQGRCYLPDADDGYVLLKEFLHDFNSRLPLISPETLQQLFRDCYSGVADDNPLAWVLVYAMIAITHRLRAMSIFAKSDDTAQSDWYLGKLLSKLPELLLQSPSLRLIQACIAMAFLLETSGRCNRAVMFVSTALHMAQDLGYNELTPNEEGYREKRYTFWLAFCLDAHRSLSTQRPGAQRLADITTPIPGENVENWWHSGEQSLPSPQPTLNVFALHCSLAVIEAEATDELFSARARLRSQIANAGAYENLLLQLQAWRERNILSKVEARDVLKATYRSDIVHFIMLEGAYFRTIYGLRATNALVSFRTKIDVFTAEYLQSLLKTDTTSLRDDALRLLRLLVLVPQGNVSTTWAALQGILAALSVVIHAYTMGVYSPGEQKREILQICKDVLVALDVAAENVTDTVHASAIDMCRRMYYRAQGV